MRRFWMVAALIASIGPVHAEGDCDLIDKLLKSTASGFISIRAKSTGTGNYESKIVLPNADSCEISMSEPASYECVWSDFKSNEQRIAQARALGESLRKCIPAEPNVSERQDLARYTFRLRDQPRAGSLTTIRLTANPNVPRINFEIDISR